MGRRWMGGCCGSGLFLVVGMGLYCLALLVVLWYFVPVERRRGAGEGEYIISRQQTGL